eukprot:TRINITY_DN6684_c0_g1_i1.p1 TRINITY_DN6684_c0_g1~~TRINITY_DN6684_c0_g1_i1.p1  ORF type:complete len:204 (-),score=22.94 TRINITY_DN6684_c0_g1_i1:113-724(-)
MLPPSRRFLPQHLLDYEGPNSDEYEQGNFSNASCSLSWSSSGPAATEVPMSGLCQALPKQEPSLEQQRIDADRHVAASSDQRNPLPTSGSRRDACGCPSIGSEGHEFGRCKGPCKDLRSGRGCTFGKKCKRCHLPHPEVSSTAIRKQRILAKKLGEQFIQSCESHSAHQIDWIRSGKEAESSKTHLANGSAPEQSQRSAPLSL